MPGIRFRNRKLVPYYIDHELIRQWGPLYQDARDCIRSGVVVPFGSGAMREKRKEAVEVLMKLPPKSDFYRETNVLPVPGVHPLPGVDHVVKMPLSVEFEMDFWNKKTLDDAKKLLDDTATAPTNDFMFVDPSLLDLNQDDYLRQHIIRCLSTPWLIDASCFKEGDMCYYEFVCVRDRKFEIYDGVSSGVVYTIMTPDEVLSFQALRDHDRVMVQFLAKCEELRRSYNINGFYRKFRLWPIPGKSNQEVRQEEAILVAQYIDYLYYWDMDKKFERKKIYDENGPEFYCDCCCPYYFDSEEEENAYLERKKAYDEDAARENVPIPKAVSTVVDNTFYGKQCVIESLKAKGVLGSAVKELVDIIREMQDVDTLETILKQ